MRPNILWITTHDINPHIGAYAGVFPGAEYAVTPNLDRLADEGIRFDNAFSAAPICAPSRSAVMTGCFPTSIGTMHMRTKAVPPAGVRLLSEYFREAGYYVTNNSFTDFQVQTPVSAFDECSDTAHWRDRPDPEQPFFAIFHGMTTHESQIYLEDAAFAARTSHVAEADRHDPAEAPLPPYYPDMETFRKAWAHYSDLITEMDWEVGELLAQLEEDGLAENTIVVFWSDHGLGMPRGKRWPNDSGLHEPLIVRWPGAIEPGTSTDQLVHLMDLAPSMLRAAGIDVPEHMQASAFLDESGIIDAGNAYTFGARDRTGEAEDMSRTVRDKRFRYIRHFHPDRPPMQHCDYPDHLWTWREFRTFASIEAGQRARGENRSALTPVQRQLVLPSKPEEELFDMQADPHETVNLVRDPAFAEVLERMRGALADWQGSTGDLGLVDEDELRERWRPGGVWPRTEQPVDLVSPTDGSVTVWTNIAPQQVDVPATDADRMGSPRDAIGAPPVDGRRWRIVCDATPVPADRAVWVKAVRLGWLDSDEVVIAA